MLDVPGWFWAVAYALAGAVFGVWLLREMARNETLRGRFVLLEDALLPLFDRPVTRRLVVASCIACWPATVAMIAIWDVPGHGKNVRPGEEPEVPGDR